MVLFLLIVLSVMGSNISVSYNESYVLYLPASIISMNMSIPLSLLFGDAADYIIAANASTDGMYCAANLGSLCLSKLSELAVSSASYYFTSSPLDDLIYSLYKDVSTGLYNLSCFRITYDTTVKIEYLRTQILPLTVNTLAYNHPYLYLLNANNVNIYEVKASGLLNSVSITDLGFAPKQIIALNYSHNLIAYSNTTIKLYKTQPNNIISFINSFVLDNIVTVAAQLYEESILIAYANLTRVEVFLATQEMPRRVLRKEILNGHLLSMYNNTLYLATKGGELLVFKDIVNSPNEEPITYSLFTDPINQLLVDEFGVRIINANHRLYFFDGYFINSIPSYFIHQETISSIAFSHQQQGTPIPQLPQYFLTYMNSTLVQTYIPLWDKPSLNCITSNIEMNNNTEERNTSHNINVTALSTQCNEKNLSNSSFSQDFCILTRSLVLQERVMMEGNYERKKLWGSLLAIIICMAATIAYIVFRYFKSKKLIQANSSDREAPALPENKKVCDSSSEKGEGKIES